MPVMRVSYHVWGQPLDIRIDPAPPSPDLNCIAIDQPGSELRIFVSDDQLKQLAETIGLRLAEIYADSPLPPWAPTEERVS